MPELPIKSLRSDERELAPEVIEDLADLFLALADADVGGLDLPGARLRIRFGLPGSKLLDFRQCLGGGGTLLDHDAVSRQDADVAAGHLPDQIGCRREIEPPQAGEVHRDPLDVKRLAHVVGDRQDTVER